VQQKKYIAGLQEGLEKGREESKKKQLAIAKNMLKKGLDDTLVAEVTGLSLDIVKTLL
jgi:predicted transposase/invertase (TIGR01784 family)